MSTQRKLTRLLGIGVVAMTAAALAGCASGGGGDEGADGEASGEITVWSWSTNAKDIAELFEEEHPDIKVNLVNPGDAATGSERLQTAFQAGSGAPDVAMIEYPGILQNAMSGYIVPLTDFGIDEIKDDFADSIMSQLTVDGEVYGTPIDASPMALYYRTDLYAQAGIEPAATWEEFAQDAGTLQAALPGSHIANSAFADGSMNRMYWQAGIAPVSVEGETIAIDYDQPEIQNVLDYWAGLHNDGLTADLPIYSPEWNAAFADGTIASWVGPGWGPVILGSNAESSAGKWAVAPLPSWDGEPASAEWGGSAYTVTEQSKNKAAAAEYVKWVNHDPQAYELLFELTGSFPVLKTYIADEEFLASPFPFFGDQPVNQVLASALESVSDWQWTPFNSEVTNVSDAEYNAILEDGQDTSKTLATIETSLRDYAAKQGFTVAD
ncbi:MULTISPECIES: ABC transporter substrate-binding protein [Microbacterium]|uniref:Extracellular solute-binding protein n=1 Tax=Microbacterium wangchenii TaxID=2541726 RepID=A0ABX5SUZ0_9MICO|nr:MULTISPECIES: extracellular solute-binding protein [Microbacterium]MCK6068452.1 extracellular solute-binding protein [Microbacterium sp. EYE_512]QBR90011.1 extracellular solute-binding protein [Microbacterium wangchenii]TFV85138.1 extracellular solute-binding protein [Microbacterium sp. dk485]TXK09269.1 extracellular solute-binding protein [Microbacterium wangchenii]